MNVPRLSLLLPADARRYRGLPAPVWILVLYNVAATARSVIHMLAPDGGAQTIAGLDVRVEGGQNLIALFGQWGVEQLLIALITWIVLWRYRGLVPLMLSVATLDQLLRILVGQLKPIVSASTPPGAIGSWLLLPVILLVTTLSLIPRHAREPVAS
jgi:hypothetical protein